MPRDRWVAESYRDPWNGLTWRVVTTGRDDEPEGETVAYGLTEQDARLIAAADEALAMLTRIVRDLDASLAKTDIGLDTVVGRYLSAQYWQQAIALVSRFSRFRSGGDHAE